MRGTVFALFASSLLCLVPAAKAQFLVLPQYDNGTNMTYFQQADVNNDGKMDIVGVVGNSTESTAIVALLGNGMGGFEPPIRTTITGINSANLNQLLLGDFNGDGRTDVAIFGKDSVTGQPAVAAFLGSGGGAFQSPVVTDLAATLAPLLGICTANAADYNSDGKLDIAYASENNGSNRVSVLPGKGNGSFAAAVVTTVSAVSGPNCLATGDFNGDKKLDIALVGSGGGAVYMLAGNDNGTFKAPTVAAKAAGPYIFAADLDGTGVLDLVGLQSGSSAGINVLLGNGAGQFPTTHFYSAPGNFIFAPPAIQDLNGDGKLDIAYLAGNPKMAVVSVLLNNGSGAFNPGHTYNADGKISGGQGLIAADLNADGKADLAFGNGSGGISVTLGNGNGTFKDNFVTEASGNGAVVGNFNSDSFADLYVGYSVLLGNGDGTFRVVANSNQCNFSSVAVNDFNHDNKLDVAGPGFNGSTPAIGVCLGNGNGTFTFNGYFDQGIQHKSIFAGYYTSNGQLDLVASDEGGFSVLAGNGNGTFHNGIPTAASNTFPSIAGGTFTASSQWDVIALTLNSGVAFYPGAGNGTFGSPTNSSGPSVGQIAVTDLNRDGKHDLVIQSGPIEVLLGNGNGTFQAPMKYTLTGSGTTRPVVQDFNLDAKLDVAAGTLSGNIAVYFGDGTGKLSATPTFFRVSDPVVAIASGDFNGDGKPDLAVVLRDGYVVTLLHQ